MTDKQGTDARWSPESFHVDLNAVRDDDITVSLVDFQRPQRIPTPGESAIALDEDGYAYDSTVLTVLPDRRIYLRLRWATRRRGRNLEWTA